MYPQPVLSPPPLSQDQHSHQAAHLPSQTESPSQATTCPASQPKVEEPRRVLVAVQSGVRRFLRAGGNASVQGLGPRPGLGVEGLIERVLVPVVPVPGLVERLSG